MQSVLSDKSWNSLSKDWMNIVSNDFIRPQLIVIPLTPFRLLINPFFNCCIPACIHIPIISTFKMSGCALNRFIWFLPLSFFLPKVMRDNLFHVYADDNLMCQIECVWKSIVYFKDTVGNDWKGAFKKINVWKGLNQFPAWNIPYSYSRISLTTGDWW